MLRFGTDQCSDLGVGREAGGTVRVGLSSILQRFGKARGCRPEPLKLAHELPEDAVKMQILIL